MVIDATQPVRKGCYLCGELKREGKWWVCAATGKPCLRDPYEVEEIIEEYKITRRLREETPYPNPDCPKRKAKAGGGKVDGKI